MLFFEVWTVFPAPNFATLAIAVVVPELGPWGVGGCLVAGLIAQCVGRRWARTVGVCCSALALGFAFVPLCLLPSTIARSELEMRTALGPNYAARLPASARAIEQSGPYRLATALRGYHAQRAVRTRLDLPVRTRDGTRLGLDVYAPLTLGAHPAIVIIYGGGWIFGKRDNNARIARTFANLGYTAVTIDYRHAPQYHFPVQIDDVRDALRAIAQHASDWDIDPSRVAIIGFSAGAQLALLAAYAPEPLGIRAVIGYYAPTDLVGGYRIPPRPDPADVDRILRAYIGGTPDERMRAYVAASPLAHIRPGLPPTLLIGGGRDELVRLAFSHQFCDALRRHGVPVAGLDLPWSNHAFDAIPNGTGGQIARYYTERFLAATL